MTPRRIKRGMDYKKTTSTGAAGVHMVAAQLILLGVTPYFPMCDDHGVDLMAGNVRLQVKSSHLIKNDSWRERQHYSFGFYKNYSTKGYMMERRRRNCPVEFDFAILVGIEENRFWVVPSSEIGVRWSVKIPQKPKWVAIPPDMLARLEAGKITQKEAAAELGVDRTTVHNRFHKRATAVGGVDWEKFESAWHLLQPIELLRATAAGEPEPGRREILPAAVEE